jgi:hypothetical protein
MRDRKAALGTLIIGAGLLSLSAAAWSAESSGSSVAAGTDSIGKGSVVINGRPCKIIKQGNKGESGSTALPNGSSVTAGSGSSSSGRGCVIIQSPGAGK